MKINVKKKREAQKYGIFGQIACVRPLLALASDKVEREDDFIIIRGSAGSVGFAAFGSSTSGYGYSPPSATLS